MQQVTTNTEQIILKAKFIKFHGVLLLWGAILMLFDGYDLTIYGAVVPFLMKSWKVSAVETGLIGSYALFGMMFGALFGGIVGPPLGGILLQYIK